MNIEITNDEPTIDVLWRYAMETCASADMLHFTRDDLARIGSPEALRLRDLIERGDLAKVELQATRWMNAGLTTHAVDTDALVIVAELELPAEMSEAEAQAILAAMPTSERLPHWLNPIA
jgi:hypothetical protein